MFASDSQDNDQGEELQPPTVSQKSLDFGTIQQGSTVGAPGFVPSLQEVISNKGEQKMIWTADIGGTSWLALDKYAGTLQPGKQETINVTVDTISLAVGTYVATLTFTSVGDEKSVSTQVPVSLVISPVLPPVAGLFFGTLTSKSSRTLQQMIRNGNNQTVKWTADVGRTSWLALDKYAGTLQSGEQRLINVTVNTNSLTIGDYYATITFTSEVQGASSAGTQIPVMIHVDVCPFGDDGPHPPCRTLALSFVAQKLAGQAGWSNTLPLEFDNPVENGPVDWTLDTCGIDWINLDKKIGTLRADEHQTVKVTVQTSSLLAGTYKVDLILNFTFNPRRAGDEPTSTLIPVTLTVP